MNRVINELSLWGPVLKVEPGSAALVIVRRHFDAADEVFEISVTTHSAERFHVFDGAQSVEGLNARGGHLVGDHR